MVRLTRAALRTLGALAWLVAVAAPLAAQDWVVSGRVTASGTGTPIALAEVRTADGSRRAYTDDQGRYTLRNLPSGRVTIRVRQLGFIFRDLAIDLPASATERARTLDVVLEPIAFVLPELVAEGRCEQGGLLNTGDERARVILEQVREAAGRYRELLTAYPAVLTQRRTTFRWSERFRTVLQDTLEASPALESEPAYRPGRVLERVGRGGWRAPVPDISALASEAFDRNHCFRIEGVVGTERGDLLRISFEPLARIGDPDWQGTLFVDPVTSLPRRLEWRLTRLDPKRSPARLEALTIFAELFPSMVVADSTSGTWWNGPNERDSPADRPDRVQEINAVGITFPKDEPPVPPSVRGRQLLGPLWRPKKPPAAADSAAAGGTGAGAGAPR